jgi:hypothetical protein
MLCLVICGCAVHAGDPVAVEAYGCRLLGKNWQGIGHIAQANNRLGRADPLELITIGE